MDTAAIALIVALIVTMPAAWKSHGPWDWPVLWRYYWTPTLHLL